MNSIDKAANLLRDGWCTSDLVVHHSYDKDAYCAVGAVAEAMGILELCLDENGNPDKSFDGFNIIDDVATYNAFRATPEAKILAAETLKTSWFDGLVPEDQEHYTNLFNDGHYDEIVFEFNDDQSSKDAVISMFKKAARQLD